MKKCSNSIVYFHNFGKYDSTFIIKSLIYNNKYDIDIIERNNIIYELKVKKNYRVIIRDSILLIPMSLDKISETFCSKYKKKNLTILI